MRKSDEGAGVSSTLGIEAATLLATVTGFAGDATGRLGVATVEIVGVIVFEGVVGTAGRGAVAVAGAAGVLPLDPTVVQTPVDADCAEGTI